jgi:hypothetical protein
VLCCLGRENRAQSVEDMRLLASRGIDATSSWRNFHKEEAVCLDVELQIVMSTKVSIHIR